MMKRAKTFRFVKPAFDTDAEDRPGLRIKMSSDVPAQKRLAVLWMYANQVLALVRKNIKTNRGGRWAPIKWGPKAGMPALQGTESHWQAKIINGLRAVISPIPSKLAMWRGHTHGALIRPRRAKLLRFVGYDGSLVFTKLVKLPKRDPRPTREDLERLKKEFR